MVGCTHFPLMETNRLQCNHTHQDLLHTRKWLDILYFRGLRRILKKKSTYIDRMWAHERLLNLANTLSGRLAPGAPKHISFRQYYKIKRRKLLGHLIRTPPQNICRLAVLSPEDADISLTRRKKRVGRPRLTWLQEALKEAWERLAETPFIFENDFPALKELAIRRTDPF